MAAHNLHRDVVVGAGLLDGFAVETDTLPNVCVVESIDTGDPGLDLVGKTVNGEIAPQVNPGDRLYVVLKNTTGAPITATVSLVLEDSGALPPQ